jgi:uncharacterized membrane protein YccC
LSDAARDLSDLQWSKFAIGRATRCVPAILIPLAVGVMINKPRGGMVIASGAFTAGLGSFQQLRRSRSLPMLYASIGMCISTLIGTLAGHSGVAFVLMAGVWGFGCGLVAMLGQAALWTAQQCTIFALVAAAYRTVAQGALRRAILVLAGGLFQTVIVTLLYHTQESRSIACGLRADNETGFGKQQVIGTLRANLTTDSEFCRYGLRLGTALALGAGIYRLGGFQSGYWIPMTALIVLRQRFRETLSRGLARCVGTLIGAGLATLLAASLRPGPAALTILVVVFAWLSYALLNVNYGVFAASITSYIVFLLSFTGLPESTIVTYRTVNTVGGVMIAFAVHLIASRCWREGSWAT